MRHCECAQENQKETERDRQTGTQTRTYKFIEYFIVLMMTYTNAVNTAKLLILVYMFKSVKTAVLYDIIIL